MKASEALNIDRSIISKYVKSGDLYINKIKGISYYFIKK
jgi:hypothetical protein